MKKVFETDSELLEAIQGGHQGAWTQLITQYQGRLLNFALVRVTNQIDAEDMVQETFASLLHMVAKKGHRIDNLEAYLYTVLRNAVCSLYRTRWSRSVCLIQDAFSVSGSECTEDAAAKLPADQASVSWSVSHREQAQLQQRALIGALADIVQGFKRKPSFHNLKLCDLLFYSRLTTQKAAEIMDLNESSVRVFKHRILKQFQEKVAAGYDLTESGVIDPANVIPNIWEVCRPTCPKYSTLGRFIQEDLEPAWFEYIDFHLTTFGCHFCRASYKDLMSQEGAQALNNLHERILQSTIGFFTQIDGN